MGESGNDPLAAWATLAAQELRGRDPAELTWATPEGIAVKPIYTAADLAAIEDQDSLPGIAYRLPGDRELAAQYLLLYEMSLPYGLDLNDTINVDKSSTRMTITVQNITSKQLISLTESGEQWLRHNAPEEMFAHGVGPGVMFSYISSRRLAA